MRDIFLCISLIFLNKFTLFIHWIIFSVHEALSKKLSIFRRSKASSRVLESITQILCSLILKSASSKNEVTNFNTWNTTFSDRFILTEKKLFLIKTDRTTNSVRNNNKITTGGQPRWVTVYYRPIILTIIPIILQSIIKSVKASLITSRLNVLQVI